MMKAWILRTLGDIAFDLNGGLRGLSRENKRQSVMFWAWSKAWFFEEQAAGRIPK